MTNPKNRTPAWKVQAIYRDTRPHGDVSRDLDVPVSTVSRIRHGNIQQVAYREYAAKHGRPIWAKARKGGTTREDIIWLYETDGEISHTEAGHMLSLTRDSVRRIRRGEYYSTTYSKWLESKRTEQRSAIRHWALTKPWGRLSEAPRYYGRLVA